MRIIAGRFRGRRLRAPEGSDTRPVADRVKESVFSSLAPHLAGARVLDLYAGAGSFGIEALSRGAESAVFVESGRTALTALRGNLDALALRPPEARVVARRVERFLEGEVGEYELVFCDPPWPLASADLEGILESVTRVVGDGFVVVTRRASDRVPRPSRLEIADERRLGDTRIIRYVMANEP